VLWKSGSLLLYIFLKPYSSTNENETNHLLQSAFYLPNGKRGQEQKAQRFDLIARRVIFVSYVLLNIWFISMAKS